jgi:hypothetical protein
VKRIPRAIPSILLLALLAALPAAAAAPDWNAVKDVGNVEIVTTNEDGSARETTIWLAVVDGQGYIRTGSTRWKANVERNPDVTLRIDEAEYPLRVEFVTDPELKAQVEQALHEKYGFSDSLVGIFRIGDTNIMRLVPR